MWSCPVWGNTNPEEIQLCVFYFLQPGHFWGKPTAIQTDAIAHCDRQPQGTPWHNSPVTVNLVRTVLQLRGVGGGGVLVLVGFQAQRLVGFWRVFEFTLQAPLMVLNTCVADLCTRPQILDKPHLPSWSADSLSLYPARFPSCTKSMTYVNGIKSAALRRVNPREVTSGILGKQGESLLEVST